jgi:hypothetical protein
MKEYILYIKNEFSFSSAAQNENKQAIIAVASITFRIVIIPDLI